MLSKRQAKTYSRDKARLVSTILLTSLLALAACDDTSVTPTPERTLTGPTIEPSATFAAPQIVNLAPEQYIGQSDPTAAALAPDSALPPLGVPGSAAEGDKQAVQVTAEDGAQLSGDLYMSGAVRQPGVLLIGPDRTAWGDFPTKAHNAGFTTLVLGMRETNQADDVQAALQSLSQLAMPDKLGVVGAGTGADAALMGCAEELLCKAVVLLSPSDTPELVQAMGRYNPRPIFLSATQEDVTSFNGITALRGAATGEVFFQPFEQAGNGTALLENRPDLADLVVQWLKQYLG